MIVFNFNHCSLFTPFSCASSSSSKHVTRFNFHSWWWKVDWNYAILCSATNRCIEMGTGKSVFSIFLPRNVQSFSSFEMKLFVRPFPSFNYIIIQFSAKFKTQRVSSVCSSSIMFSPIYLSSLSYVEFFFFLLVISYLPRKKLPLFIKQKQKLTFFVCKNRFKSMMNAREAEKEAKSSSKNVLQVANNAFVLRKEVIAATKRLCVVFLQKNIEMCTTFQKCKQQIYSSV